MLLSFSAGYSKVLVPPEADRQPENEYPLLVETFVTSYDNTFSLLRLLPVTWLVFYLDVRVFSRYANCPYQAVIADTVTAL